MNDDDYDADISSFRSLSLALLPVLYLTVMGPSWNSLKRNSTNFFHFLCSLLECVVDMEFWESDKRKLWKNSQNVFFPLEMVTTTVVMRLGMRCCCFFISLKKHQKKYFEDSNQFYVTVLAVLILPSSFFYLITLSSMHPTSIEMKKE